MSNRRSKTAAERLISSSTESNKNNKKVIVDDQIIPNKKNIERLIKNQGNSIRSADSIRINPILSNALKYWTTIAEPNKTKPDVIEDTLLKCIPEEYLIQGYQMAKRQKQI